MGKDIFQKNDQEKGVKKCYANQLGSDVTLPFYLLLLFK